MSGRRLSALHVIPSLSRKHGGPSYAVRAMARALRPLGVDLTIATTDDDGDDARLNVPLGQPIEEDGINVYYFRRELLPYKISFGLVRWLRSNVAQFDLVHIHALFSFSSTVAGHYAYRKGVPYVIRPLGVLNIYGLENRRPVLKKLSMPLVESRILRYSAAIHYTSQAERMEAAAISNEIATHRSVVVPLPIEQQKGNVDDFRKRFPQVANKRVVLFLSRIDAKKGIELLLDAFASVDPQLNDIVLVIAGAGSASYQQALQERAKELRIADRVVWAGHLDGEIKAGAFAAAEVFVLSSHSENFGIAAAEAITCGVPTIVSDQVAISDEIRTSDAGIVVRADAKELALAIQRVLADREFASRLSANAMRLAAARYAPVAVGRQLRELYDSISSETK